MADDIPETKSKRNRIEFIVIFILRLRLCYTDFGQGEGDGEGGGVAGCRRGMPRSFSLLGFNFGVNFRFSGAFRWHFICSRMKYEERERESARGRLACGALRLALCARIAPWSYRLWCLSVCLTVPAPKSQFFPFFPSLLLVSFPFLCVLFSCRPRSFVDCDCDCVVFFSSLLFFLFSLALFLEAAIKNPSLMRLAPKHFEGSRICVLNPKLKPNDTERLRRHLSDWLF